VAYDLNEEVSGFGGQHLGPVGSRIVAETLIGLLWLDSSSFLHDLRRSPLAAISGGGDSTMVNFIRYVPT
jgi:hypothetical protein